MAEFRSARLKARCFARVPIVGAILLSGVVAGALSAPGTSLAASRPAINLFARGASVKTSNGLTWIMSVSSGESLSNGRTLNISIVHSDKTGTTSESHGWGFRVTPAVFQFNSKSGTATLNSGSQARPVATVDLSFKATSKSKGACESGSETIYDGSLAGSVSLVTGLEGGGTIGGKALSFTLDTNILVDSNCLPKTGVNECARASQFIAGNIPGLQVQAVGFSAKAPGYSFQGVYVSRQTNLGSPKGAIRGDSAEQDAIHETYNATTKIFSVTTGKTGFVTGSATLSGGSVQIITSRCVLSGESRIETNISDQSARYKSPPGQAISAKTSLSGTLTVPASTKRGFYLVTTFDGS